MARFKKPRREDIKGTRRVGALEIRGIEIAGRNRFVRLPVVDGRSLFLAPTPREIEAFVARFDELNLSDLLEPPPERKNVDGQPSGRIPEFVPEDFISMARIRAATGAKALTFNIFGEGAPAAAQEFGEVEQEAAVLLLFAYFYSRQNASYADVDQRFRWAHALGRLLEWWRWRSGGHDRDATMHQNRRRTSREGGGNRAKKISDPLTPLFLEVEAAIAKGQKQAHVIRRFIRQGRYPHDEDTFRRVLNRWRKREEI